MIEGLYIMAFFFGLIAVGTYGIYRYAKMKFDEMPDELRAYAKKYGEKI